MRLQPATGIAPQQRLGSSSHTPSKGSGRVHHRRSCLVSDGMGHAATSAPSHYAHPGHGRRNSVSWVFPSIRLCLINADLSVCDQSGTSVPDGLLHHDRQKPGSGVAGGKTNCRESRAPSAGCSIPRHLSPKDRVRPKLQAKGVSNATRYALRRCGSRPSTRSTRAFPPGLPASSCCVAYKRSRASGPGICPGHNPELSSGQALLKLFRVTRPLMNSFQTAIQIPWNSTVRRHCNKPISPILGRTPRRLGLRVPSLATFHSNKITLADSGCLMATDRCATAQASYGLGLTVIRFGTGGTPFANIHS